MRSVDPSIEWWRLHDKLCLKFTFCGYLTADEATNAIETWRKSFEENRGKRIVLVWDCVHMEGYSSEARSMWTKALLSMKSQIRSIWVVSHSSVVKMGASVMAMFSSMDIHIVKSEKDIETALKPAPLPFVAGSRQDDNTDSLSL